MPGLVSLKNTKLKKLDRLHIPRFPNFDSDRVYLPARPVGSPELFRDVYPPFRSVEEVIIWEVIQQYNEHWQPMVDVFGGPGIQGGTEIDFYNGILRIAIYADGPPHLDPTVAARDKVLRKAVEQIGLKVLAFQYRTPEEVVSLFPEWYADNINA